MPTQPSHHVSSLAFRISCLSWISSLGFRISPHFRKTNPIYRPTTPLSTICYLLFLTKQTQFHKPNSQSPTAKSRFSPNEPNFRSTGLKTKDWRLKTAFKKRTQFTAEPPESTNYEPPTTNYFHKTNPIPNYKLKNDGFCASLNTCKRTSYNQITCYNWL